MFKKSAPSRQASLFTGISQQLSNRKLSLLEKPDGWHNVFFREVTSQIDESIFAVLYGRMGRPNAPIRQLLAMLILKEGQNWTDEQLFESCQLDLRVMRALGLTDFTEEIPVASTYYDFKSRLVNHKANTGEDLLEEAFQKLTKSQLIKYQVNGQEVRMDSKLLNSNIAKCTRLQLVINVIRKFYQSLSDSDKALVHSGDQQVLEALQKQTASQRTYRLSNVEKEEMLRELGLVLLRLKQSFTQEQSSEYALVERLLEEQYQSKQASPLEEVQPKDKNDIDGGSLQSPHDVDATYRHKKSGDKKQVIRGYSCNLTETCAEDDLHLIVDVQTATASTGDDKFFQPALEKTRKICDQVHSVWSDGAFNSESNLAYTKKQGQLLNWYISALQGQAGNYDFEWTAQGQLKVTDRRNARIQIAHQTPSGRFRIDEDFKKNKYHYLELKNIKNYFRRQQIKQWPDAIRKRRPNVEATIHQVFYNLKAAKSKYRGMTRNHFFVLSRCFWVNFKRIWTHKAQNSLNSAFFGTLQWIKRLIGLYLIEPPFRLIRYQPIY